VSWLFAVAILGTLVVLGVRRFSSARSRAERRAQVGRNPNAPLRVHRFDAIDATVGAARCGCGGRVSVVSEGSVSLGTNTARVVHGECVLCEESHDFFFDLSGVTH
jgi:hypothetical protein